MFSFLTMALNGKQDEKVFFEKWNSFFKGYTKPVKINFYVIP